MNISSFNRRWASRIVAAVAVLGLVSTGVFGSLYVSDHDEARWAGIAPPAQDALTQSLDLDRIASFRYVDDGQVQITDELGHLNSAPRRTSR